MPGVIESKIDGVIIKKLELHQDSRGWLVELFRADSMKGRDLPVMAYVSMSLPGIVRGPHEHREQTDNLCFVGPSNFEIYLWDNRSNSTTYETKQEITAGEDFPTLISIPPGVVHAYKNIGEIEGLVFNAPDRLYAGDGKNDAVDEIRHENDTDSRFRVE